MPGFSSGGPPPIAGLSSDGANGVVVAGAITAGRRAVADVPDLHTFYGSTTFQDAPANNADVDSVVIIRQSAPILPSSVGIQALYVTRTGSIAQGDYQTEVVHIGDQTASAQPVATLVNQAATVLRAGYPTQSEMTVGGHLDAIGTIPTVSHNGVNTVGTLPRATDLRGIISLVLSSTGSAANAELCTITFAVAYAAAPIIVVSALDDATATALPLGAFYVDQTTTPLTTFMLKCTSALAAGTYRCAYVILG